MKRIGIKQLDIYTIRNLKNEFLFFDQLLFDSDLLEAIFSAQINLEELKSRVEISLEFKLEKIDQLRKEIDYLQENNILTPFSAIQLFSKINKHRITPELLIEHEKLLDSLQDYQGLLQTGRVENARIDDPKSLIIMERSIHTRICSNIFSIINRNTNYIPVTNESAFTRGNKRKESVLKIVLNKLPIPSDSVSWNQLIDFKKDPDTRSKFMELRNWITEISYSKLNQLEIEERLDLLLNKYEEHMKQHKVKYNLEKFELLVTTTAEVLENLVTIRWSKLAKTLFSLRRKKVALFEEEKKAPGNEVAFISKAKSFLEKEGFT